ncbi:uncharacterized protein K460DRAFT_416576 [Cucurbitaria berberidis CBS 394.84]|uniref:C2H2-type domain-containing protein n=1 Tax=Cucurbitaria berberidis CBS 394.84 TaxID=1168544 RepID=A0A9P4L8J3_9PLEO|nr:uncharacterized protein K460DRAFT_416576 [Cucurbitaria berberidis CBS 394.84]KAF1845299.1 hypothetical protein K460DRAFT_416576 [Cucurbitaria berberidis CBS 394.84]
MSTTKPFNCDSCSETFTRCENLKRHKRTRHGESARISFECSHCHAKFIRRDICKRHSNRCQEKRLERRRTSLRSNATAAFVRDTAHLPQNEVFQDTSPAVEFPLAPSSAESPNRKRQRQPQSPIIDPSFAEDIDVGSIDSIWPGDFGDESQGAERTDAPVSSGLTDSSDSIELFVASYFEHFHPSLPIIHRGTFQASTVSKPLLNIVIIIGSLYSVAGFRHDIAAGMTESSRRLWAQGVQELDRLRCSDWRELRKTWVMQAWLLHIVVGAYVGDSTQYNGARRLLRYLVDTVRDLGLLNQAVVGTMMPATNHGVVAASDADDMQPLEQTWMSYVQEESLKISLQTLLFLDHHIFSSCNMRPLLSSVEFVWELPLSSALWEAEDAMVWRLKLMEQHGDATALGDVLEWPIPLGRGLYTTASQATQSLMSESPCPQLLNTLLASPMATLAVLTNLDSLVRDFTRCYYQLPPSPSDPSAYHILTQSQNRRVVAALKVLSKLIWTKLSSEVQPSHESLWRTCDMIGRSIKLSLCKPDDLLVGGIVESSITAALMTATQLTLGSYVAVRRATQSLLTLHGADEGTLSITDDLTAALAKIAGASPSLAHCEGPWMTAICYRILLLIWKTLRWAIAEIREKLNVQMACLGTTDELPRSFGACSLILNSLMETILLHTSEFTGTADKCNRLWAADAQSLSTLLDDSEADLVNLIIHICKARPVWTIGPAMARVADEILPTITSTTAQESLHIV